MNQQEDINLAICGHAWHGKSTLLGKLVAESGMATPREIDAARKLASEGRDPSFVFAQLVFRSKDVTLEQSEAARGVTVLPSIVRFEYPQHRITVIDTPGQETYANNRFFGMFQADCAVLVVDAEEGIKPITQQAIRILRGFEIPLLGVAITKMDRVQYGQKGFEEACDEVRMALEDVEIDYEHTIFMPTSAYAPQRGIHEPGEGVTSFQKIDWYDGPTVRDFLRELRFEKIRPAQQSLRLVIHGSEVYDNVPGIGKTATALVETGEVKADQTLIFEPISAERNEKVTARVRSVQLTRGHIATPGISIEKGVPRQLVGVAFKGLSEKESLRDLFKGRGVVAGLKESPPRVARSMILEMTVFDAETLLAAGGQWTLHVHVDRVPVSIEAVLAKRPVGDKAWTDCAEGEVLGQGEWGKVKVTTITRPVAMEESGSLPPLARFVLRKEHKAVAYGRCLEILE
jgi:translation elongation factor EF-1alpha